jgi:lysyl-tRNA synthetase, class II
MRTFAADHYNWSAAFLCREIEWSGSASAIRERETERTVMSLSEHQQRRLEKLQELREQGIDPYPPRSNRTHTAAEALEKFAELEDTLNGEHDSDEITVAGRVMTIRDMGKSIFCHLQDGTGSIQLFLRRNDLGEEQHKWFKRMIDMGDFIEARGKLFRTRMGEITIQVSSFTMLSKALNPPPEKWHGLADVETRYRQRYADLISNEEVRDIFVKRTKIIRAMRSFLDSRGFMEVETPTLQPLYGGAAARPFTSHYHSLDQTFFLRIADELYLKRLIVGGFERVYEICKDFRNEGIDARHSPEFTMIEFYMAYADYNDVMDLTEQMIIQCADEALGCRTFTYDGHEIDLTPPWPRVTLRNALLEATGIDYLEVRDQKTLYQEAKRLGADVYHDEVWPRIVDELMKTFVRPTLIQPTFLIDYPVALSPLAKRSPKNPDVVERFQPFIAGVEAGNAFTELNDPLDQLTRFLEQARDREAGDQEAMPIDEDYVNALMHGMPPTGGFGLGVDRLVMLFTDQQNIREVILFPHLRNKPEGMGLADSLEPYLDSLNYR